MGSIRTRGAVAVVSCPPPRGAGSGWARSGRRTQSINSRNGLARYSKINRPAILSAGFITERRMATVMRSRCGIAVPSSEYAAMRAARSWTVRCNIRRCCVDSRSRCGNERVRTVVLDLRLIHGGRSFRRSDPHYLT